MLARALMKSAHVDHRRETVLRRYLPMVLATLRDARQTRTMMVYTLHQSMMKPSQVFSLGTGLVANNTRSILGVESWTESQIGDSFTYVV